MFFNRLKHFFFRDDKRDEKLAVIFFLFLVAKFVWFDLAWCAMSTFTPFSKIDTYWDTLLISLVFLLPFVCFRVVKTTLLLFVLLDIFLLANLMYFRTYYTAIPLDSYRLLGNLSDFTTSIWNSLWMMDLFFPLSTLLVMYVSWKILHYRLFRSLPVWKGSLGILVRYLLLLLLIFMFPATWIYSQNGFKAVNERLKDAYLHTCNVPMFTLFGALYYDYISDNVVYTDDIRSQITTWLADKPTYQSRLSGVCQYDNCILIVAESLESWVLEQTIEGKEITPNLNKLLKEPSTLYAPKVLTQVKGGRSIDAQLLFNCGLLPIKSGAYSIKYPGSYYPSLPDAFKGVHPDARAYTLTVDKPMVWNQCVINPVMRYDSLISKACFIQEEPVGSRGQIGDCSFLRQCSDKMRKGEVWSNSGNTFLQCITYSGHNPFILPEKLKGITFSEKVPVRIADYTTIANYTDRAIGAFLSVLRSDTCFNNTLIVIIGDHEGLAAERAPIRNTDLGRAIVSDKCFTPLIVLNAPVTLRYNKVMGQVDVYPTLLDLLGLNEYEWKGIGTSILDVNKGGFAIDPSGNVIGDTTGVGFDEIQRAKDAWDISDLIIRHDYLGRMKRKE